MADCPRRFQLRYVQSQAWPGVQAEPIARSRAPHRGGGTRFHRLGRAPPTGYGRSQTRGTESTIPNLRVWWQAYLNFDRLQPVGRQHYPNSHCRLNWVVVRLARLMICWLCSPVSGWSFLIGKRRCGSCRASGMKRGCKRGFTRMCWSGRDRCCGACCAADQVSMIYWVCGAPDDPVIFEYNERRFCAGRAYLEG